MAQKKTPGSKRSRRERGQHLLTTVALGLLTACSRGGTVPVERMPQALYVPQAVYCSAAGPQPGGSPLCPVIPGNIGPDPAIEQTVAYNGIIGQLPTSAKNDPQTPFDNLSWQTFIALNWAQGQQGSPASQGLQGNGLRVWQGWPRVSDVFGNAPVVARCDAPAGMPVFAIGSDGQGNPEAHNEEYIQAATGEPAIDVSGNWTIYERRLNGVEVTYLQAPGGNTGWNLTTQQGQQNLIKGGGTVDFPAVGDQGAATGAIEIKAAWRVLDPAWHAENQKRFYVVTAMLTVAPDLVRASSGAASAPICATVDLGLVAMHIMQKNPVTQNALKPEWFWTTFEHVDNVPMATQPCDPTSPGTCAAFNQLDCPVLQAPSGTNYSYFNPQCLSPDCKTNQPPTASSGGHFYWNPTQPFAKAYQVTANSQGKTVTVGTQISRCWSVYPLTQQLNVQWRAQLARVGSVFQNYMLVGTQWGASITDTPNPRVPSNAVPSYLSNSVVETYLQTFYDPKNPFNTGSCVSCHAAATLAEGNNVPSNLSFLPGLAQPVVLRRPPVGVAGHEDEIRRE
ncbi:hypothetical protein [Corallococcus caeni]|uniref:Cytochrome c family protein n=1 Tax=Corallococcus caeni TaxID=3082388 RepID=A0ABQ6R2F5_9BACT|nr:hypothetical protein ASNO1_63350 [Corallococcus sp. NO1]